MAKTPGLSHHPLRVAIHQPNFLPRLKVLQKLSAADVWVVLDSAQYSLREWQNRSRIVPLHGDLTDFWLTLPVVRKNGQRTLIRDIEIVEPAMTTDRVSSTLLHSFRRAPYWPAVSAFLETVSPVLPTPSLTKLCVDTTMALLEIGGNPPDVHFS